MESPVEKFFKEKEYKPDEKIFTAGHYNLPYYSEEMILKMMEEYGEAMYVEGYKAGFREGYNVLEALKEKL